MLHWLSISCWLQYQISFLVGAVAVAAVVMHYWLVVIAIKIKTFITVSDYYLYFLLINTSYMSSGRKLNVHTIFRRRSGRFPNVLRTFKLRPVSREWIMSNRNFPKFQDNTLWWYTYISQEIKVRKHDNIYL